MRITAKTIVDALEEDNVDAVTIAAVRSGFASIELQIQNLYTTNRGFVEKAKVIELVQVNHPDDDRMRNEVR